MNQQFIIVGLVTLTFAVGTMFIVQGLRHRKLWKWYKGSDKIVPLTPVSDEFEKLLETIQSLDTESKMRIVQAVMGGKILFGTIMTSKNASLCYARHQDFDADEMIKEDKSIG